jgi:hypothetical protein
LTGEHSIGESAYLVTGGREGKISLAVPLKCTAVAVVRVSIGFDHQARLSPEKVNEEPPDLHVYLWSREPRLAAQREKVGLQQGAGIAETGVDV